MDSIVSSYTTILAAIAPVFLLMVLGLGLRWSKLLTREADASLLKMVVNFFYPALILYFTLGNAALRDPVNLLQAPLFGFITVVTGFMVAWKVGRWLGLEVGKGRRSFAFTVGIYNYGYIPIPLVAALFASRETTGVLLLFNVGVEIAFWTVGVLLISGAGIAGSWRKILNPPVLALLIALVLNSIGVAERMPGFLNQTLAMVSACAIPLGLVLAGATLADLLQENNLLGRWKIWVGACGLRLLLLPIGFLLLAAYWPWLSDDLRRVLVIQAAMPAGIFPIVVARHYGGDASVAVIVVLSTTFLALITIPLWVTVGFRFVFG